MKDPLKRAWPSPGAPSRGIFEEPLKASQKKESLLDTSTNSYCSHTRHRGIWTLKSLLCPPPNMVRILEDSDTAQGEGERGGKEGERERRNHTSSPRWHLSPSGPSK